MSKKISLIFERKAKSKPVLNEAFSILDYFFTREEKEDLDGTIATKRALPINSIPDIGSVESSLVRILMHHFFIADRASALEKASKLRKLFELEFESTGILKRYKSYLETLYMGDLPDSHNYNPMRNSSELPDKIDPNQEEFFIEERRVLNQALSNSFSQVLNSLDEEESMDSILEKVVAITPDSFIGLFKNRGFDRSVMSVWGDISDPSSSTSDKLSSGEEKGGEGSDDRQPGGEISGPRSQDIEGETTPDDKLDGTSSKFAVPVFKKFSGEEQAQGAPARSLASQLMKLFPNIPKEVLMNVLKGVAKQLKGNNIKIQENKDFFVQTLIEQLLLEKPSRAQRQKNKQKMATSKKLGQPTVKKMGSGKFLAQRPDGEKKEFHQLGYGNNLAAAKKAAQDWANGVQTVDQAGAEIEVDDKDIVGTIEKPKAPGQTLKDTAYVMLYKHIVKVQKHLDMDKPAGLDAAMKVDQAFLGVFKFYRALQSLEKFLEDPKTANALDDNSAERIIKMMPLKKKLDPINEVLSQKEKEDVKADQSAEPGLASYKVRLLRLTKNLISAIQRSMLRYPPHKNNAQIAIDRAKKILSDTRKGKAGVKDPKDPGYSPADTEIQKGSINVKQLVGPQLKAADLFDPAKDKQDMRVAKSQAARLKAQGKDKEARTVLAKAKKKTGGAALQRDITKVIRRFLNKQMQRIGADMNIVAENRELFETALIEELKNRGLIK